jgi:glycosyltransferase involved in cell wall biosynthesis
MRPLARRVGIAALVASGVVVGVAFGFLFDDRRRQYLRVRSDLDRRRARPAPPGEHRLSVVVPAFGEGFRIGDTVQRLRADLAKVARDGGVEIVVVDDGSTDDTSERARAAGADQVLRHDRNRGKGAAVRTGVLAARGRTVAFTDADLAYSPDQLVGLLDEVEAGWDVVVGSRRHTDTTTLVRARRLREVGGRAINVLTRAVLLGQYRDTQCGLKAFRSDVARRIFQHTRVDGFAFDVEVFFLVEQYHLSLAEVPVRIENSSRSTVHVARDALRLVEDLFRIRSLAHHGAYDLTSDDIDLDEA